MEKDKLHLDQHISQKFNEELEDIRNRVLKMGGLVEEQIDRAIRALVTGDSELGQDVVREDYKVNECEVDIDEECSRILARRQPAASDLRLIVAIIKTITDLERIGDEAEKIGYLASRLAEVERPAGNYSEIERLGQQVRSMLRAALDAFARLDTAVAIDVAKQDDSVDAQYESIMRQSITYMMEDPRSIKRILDVMWCARALERIGDHAKNIGEYIVYLVHGKDIRHTSMEDVERELGDGGR